MNVFEKYIANVHENENLSKVIDKLCYAYLVSNNDVSERIRFKRFVKFVKWEFEEAYHPKEITLTYIEEDTRTHEETECKRKLSWNDLLIQVDNYE